MWGNLEGKEKSWFSSSSLILKLPWIIHRNNKSFHIISNASWESGAQVIISLLRNIFQVQVLFSNTIDLIHLWHSWHPFNKRYWDSSCVRHIFASVKIKSFFFFWCCVDNPPLRLLWHYLTELRETAECLQSRLRFPHSNAKFTQQDFSHIKSVIYLWLKPWNKLNPALICWMREQYHMYQYNIKCC